MVNFFGQRWVQRLVLRLGHLFLGLQKYWTISCPVIRISFVIHVVQRSILASPPTSPPAYVATSGVVILFSHVEGSSSIL
jgi:hypothetical protein